MANQIAPTSDNLKIYPVKWDEHFFASPSEKYNHLLAKLSMGLSAAAYPAEMSYTGDEAFFIQNMLTQMDMENIISFNYNRNNIVNYFGDGDSVGYTFATKKILLPDGEHDLYIIAIRGSYKNEWFSNFRLGTEHTHIGFKIAAQELLQNFSTYYAYTGGSNSKILVTGHSRGAAVANLVAKELSDGGSYSFTNRSNMFAYTFATPNVSKLAIDTELIYNNIFNIIHYDDFVTVMPLRAWGFGRYGVTLEFPRSKETLLKQAFYDLTGTKFVGYNGDQEVDQFEDNLWRLAPTPGSYYDTSLGFSPFHYFNGVATLIAGTADGILDHLNITYIISTIADREGFGPISRFFAGYYNDTLFTSPALVYSHAVETYISWLNALPTWLSPDDAYNYYEIRIACPVDVYVYDEEGQLVGSVIGGVVNADIVNPVNIRVEGVDNDVKIIRFPVHKTFNIVLEATDEGEMTYTVSVVEDGSGKTISSKTFSNVQLAAGKQMVGVVSPIETEEWDENEELAIGLFTVDETGTLYEIQENGMEVPSDDVVIIARSEGGGAVTGDGKFGKNDPVC